MTYAEIEAFLAVVECGTISKAAEKLFVSQSTLSSRINSLEAKLGMTLFIRGKGIRNSGLSVDGESFIGIAEKWQNLWRETWVMAHAEKRKLLSTGAPQSINSYIMPEVCRRIADRMPDISMRIQTWHVEEVYQKVGSGESEIGFTALPQYSVNVDTIPLFREKMLFITSVPGEGEMHPSALDAKNEVYFRWHREYPSWHEYWFGGTLPGFFTDNMGMLESALAEGERWAVAPVTVAEKITGKGKAHVRPFRDGPPDRVMHMLLKHNAKPSEQLILMLRIMHEVLDESGITWLYEP
ncbi:MAG: LysR family transcriptional regulator [Oscillospiraceae bacterium]|nr:LysR family transcriptional regulator [Oscillospiraceae bacterium]